MRLTLPRLLCAAALALPATAHADGYYNLTGPEGDKWGEIAFMEVVGNDTVWVWGTEEGDVTFFIQNLRGNQGDWSLATYFGYFAVDLPEQIAPPCEGGPITDAYGNSTRQWGIASISWNAQDDFFLNFSDCGTADALEVRALYAWGEGGDAAIAPASAVLDLQAYRIPLSYNDPAGSQQGVMYNPAIYLDVTMSDGSPYDGQYHVEIADNVIFDDVSGDPYDLIEVEYWDIENGNPAAGQFAAQLSATGRGTGTATLFVGFQDAPGVTAEVTVEVVTGN